MDPYGQQQAQQSQSGMEWRAGGKGGGKDSGKDQGGPRPGDRGADRGGGKGGQQRSQGQPAGGQAQGSAKKAAKPASQMTMEEYQAAQEAKKAARKAEKAAAPKPAAQPRVLQKEKPEVQELPEEKPEPPQVEEKPKPAEPPPVAEEGGDDWEAQADEAGKPAVDDKPEPKESPPAEEAPKEIPKVKDAPQDQAKEEDPEMEDEEDEAAGGKAKAPTDVSKLKVPDPRPHLNVVFIGHVDAGKSTTCGNVLFLSGCVDERTVEKYQKEAKDKNRESWFLAYIMDTNDEEKAKGKTVEVGRATFATDNKRFTILDAPGHKSYVPNMIAGASQADVGVLIISARKGEFETGFERGGQTREHATLAKTLGIDRLIVGINKMDDPSVQWDKARYDDIVKKLSSFIKPPMFKADQVIFLPMSGLTGDNVKDRKNTPDWFTGSTLLGTLDGMEPPQRKVEAPFRIPMLDGFRDMGAIMAVGKVEQGVVRPGTQCIVQPIGHRCKIASVFIGEGEEKEEVQFASVGENIGVKMVGCSEEELRKGYVLSPISDPVRAVTKFKCQLQVLELPEERPVMTAGLKAVMHAHVANEECEIVKLYESINMKDRKKQKNPTFVREGMALICSISLARSVALDVFTGAEQLGRFTLRDEGRTIAIGKITELPKEK